MDLVAAIDIDTPMVLEAGAYAMIPTGISIALPLGYECQVRPRSGLAKNGVTVLNSRAQLMPIIAARSKPF